MDPASKFQEMDADPDTVYHLCELLVGAPLLQIVVWIWKVMSVGCCLLDAMAE